MAVKSADQITVLDITDGYTVVLSMDSANLNGGVNGLASSQTINVVVNALRGSQQITPTVNKSDCTCTPSSVTIGTISTDGYDVTLPITLPAGLATSGTVEIPVKIVEGNDTITITKTFSFAIALRGQTGGQGPAGTSVTVTRTEYAYQLGSSGTTPPTGTWQANPQAPTTTQFAWTRTTTTFSDGSTAVTYTVGGKTGTNGTSPTVTNSKTQYQKSTSGTTVPTGTWSDTALAPDVNNYVWTKTTVTYSNGNTAVSYAVAGKQGQRGPQGNPGAAGADAITMAITTNNGNIFRNNSGSTILTAHVYKAGVEVTGSALSALGSVKWYKDGGSSAVGTGTTFTVNASDVANKAVYEARLEG